MKYKTIVLQLCNFLLIFAPFTVMAQETTDLQRFIAEEHLQPEPITSIVIKYARLSLGFPFPPDEELSEHYSYKFDAQGNKIEYASFDGTTSRLRLFNGFDSRGNQLEAASYSYGELNFQNKYLYDENNNRIEKKSFDADGSIIEKEIFSYTGNGEEQTSLKYGEGGGLLQETRYEYDGLGSLINLVTLDESGDVTYSLYAEYYYNDLKEITEIITFEDGIKLSHDKLTYDDIQGTLLEGVEYDSDGEIEFQIKKEYDEEDVLKEEVKRNSDGEVLVLKNTMLKAI